MFAHHPLALERTRVRQRIGLCQHLADFFEALAARVSDAVQMVHVHKVDQNTRHVVCYRTIVTQFSGHQIREQPAQRVIVSNPQGPWIRE